ncbi:minor capsid protein [Capybara microvirus Cap1_SP_141]|nr:minor capsid protein [Capybara microvirus Cap1_SP_141]
MTRIRHNLDLDPIIPTVPGNPIKVTYKGRMDKNGVVELVPTGKVNVYDFIQSFRNECDIHSLIDKYQMTQDPSLLDLKPTYFGDFTDVPTNIIEVWNKVEEAKEFFNSQDPKIKEAFNYDAYQFLAKAGTEEFMTVVSNALLDKKVEVIEDVKESE